MTQRTISGVIGFAKHTNSERLKMVKVKEVFMMKIYPMMKWKYTSVEITMHRYIFTYRYCDKIDR